MNRCNNCGTNVADNLRFCTNCGNKLTDFTSESKDNCDNSKKKRSISRIIKRIIIAVLVIIGLLLLWGNHLINSTTYMTFNSDGELFAKSGGVSEVNIDFDGYIWELNYKPSWVSVDEYDRSFTIRCQPNTTGRDREDHITIKSGKVVLALPIGQYGEAQYIRLSENSIRCDTDGDRIHVSIETDGCCPEISYPEFCYIENQSEDGFTIVIPSNSEYSRSGKLFVKEDRVSASIFISQEGKCSVCHGNGTLICPNCRGIGTTGFGFYNMNCFNCGGLGYVKCYSCLGNGMK